MKTAFFTHPIFSHHDNGPGHPERPERLQAIEEVLRREGLWDHLLHPEFAAAKEKHLLLCHHGELVEQIRRLAEHGGGTIDGDTHVAPVSYEAASMAVGAALRAVDGVLTGEWSNAFVASRPPGHHATPSRAMGFCLFNAIAVAARYAESTHKLHRVAVVDFDVHHGNGTQDIFYEDGSVFFGSVHQSPLYPGTGRAEERGRREGEGSTLNIPLRPGKGDVEYSEAWATLGNTVKAFKPELILVSAGFDAHADDPLGGMNVTANGFANLMQQTMDWANEVCSGRVVCVLEGGYSLRGLSESVAAVIKVLLHPSHMALLLDDNLMTSGRIASQLQHAGYHASTLSRLPDKKIGTEPAVVLINLSSRQFGNGSVITKCREKFPEARIVGFCGHLEVELRRTAKAAGIDKLLTNEQVLSQLNEYL